MAIDSRLHPVEHPPPPNTVVVLPKSLPTNRGALWMLFWTIGLLMGLFARSIVNGPGDVDPLTQARGSNGSSADRAALAEAQPTVEVHLRAVLELPSPTATSTPRPTATATPDATGQVDFCADNQPGKLCRVPLPPPPTPTPYPSCVDMAHLAPGDWCVWPTAPPEVARARP
jgi:hypothetical protein